MQFEPTDHPLHEVTFPIGLLVKVGVGLLVPLLGDDRVNAMVLEPLANTLTAVAFVGDEFAGPFAMAPSLPLRAAMHHRFKGAALMLLAGLDADGDRDAVPLNDHVDLGAEAASRAAQRMIWWLNEMRSLAAEQPCLGGVTRSCCIAGGS